jgi:hypothetical protein
MGLINKVLRSKKEDTQGQQKIDSFWRETDYGYAPKDTIKVHFTPEREVYPKYVHRPQEAPNIAASHIVDLQQKVKYLDSKTFNYEVFLQGKCGNCNKYLIIPETKKPPFFKCPFCSSENEKKLIELLLFLNPDNEIFASCPECNKYSYLKVDEEDRYLKFHCKSCKKALVLNKDHPIELTNFSKEANLSWCSACGLLFESPLNEKYPITCSRCESKLEPKQ